MDNSSLNLKTIPTYGFQFALSHLETLRNSFIKITLISVLGGLFGFYGTYLLADLISGVTTVSYDQIAFFYIPVFISAYAIKELLEYFTRRDGEAFSTLACNRFYQKFYAAILKSDISALSNLNKEELLIASSRYIGRAGGFLGDWVWNTSRKISQFILVLIILGSQSIYICLGSLLYLIIFLYFALNLSRRFAPYAQKVATTQQLSSSQLTQSYLAASIIRRLRLEDFFLGKLQFNFDEQSASVISSQRFHAKRWLLQLNAFNFLYISSLFYGIYQVKAGSLQLGFLLLIRYAFDRLWEIIVFIIEKYISLVQEKEETGILRNLLQPLLTLNTETETKINISTFNKIKIENVKIALLDSKRAAGFELKIPGLEIKLGDRISIKAPSGSGKSTFLLSLMNLTPITGSITFDGVDLQQISQSPDLVSYVSPSEPLFPLSLTENITLGRNCSKETIDSVIEGLGISDFIANPAVVIGKADVNLSLGQTQRIRLARALVAKSPLLLLDEPFTGLDPESRERIKNFIVQSCKNSTIILASHDSEDRLIASRHLTIIDGILSEKNNQN